MSQNQSTHDSPAVEVGPEHAEFTWKCLSPAYEITWQDHLLTPETKRKP